MCPAAVSSWRFRSALLARGRTWAPMAVFPETSLRPGFVPISLSLPARQRERRLRLCLLVPFSLPQRLGFVFRSVAQELQFAAASLSWSARIAVSVAGVAVADLRLVGRTRACGE